MAGVVAVCALVLFCSLGAHGARKGGALPPIPSFDGIYDGRFNGIVVSACFDQGGVRGDVVFSQRQPGAPVEIHFNLEGLDQFAGEAFGWGVRDFPVRTSLLMPFPCDPALLGDIYNPTGCDTSADLGCAVGDFDGRLGALRSDQQWQVFTDDTITLYGSQSVINRALVIEREGGVEGDFICANINQHGARLEILRAGFSNGVIQGDVIFRYAIGRDDATVEVDLNFIDGNIADNTTVPWSLNFGQAGSNNSCDGVEKDTIFGSTGFDPTKFECGPNKQRECIMGDMTSKCGPLVFFNNRARICCTDNQLGSVPRTYLFDKNFPNDILTVVIGDESTTGCLGCSTLEMIRPVVARAQFRFHLTGFADLYFWQTGPDDVTNVRAHITGLDTNDDYSLRIFTNPAEPMGNCSAALLGPMISRPGSVISTPPNPNILTDDMCDLGNLDAIVPIDPGTPAVRLSTKTNFLPLFGPFSVVGNSVGLFRLRDSMIVGCATIMRQEAYPQGELASLLGYQDIDNRPIPPV